MMKRFLGVSVLGLLLYGCATTYDTPFAKCIEGDCTNGQGTMILHDGTKYVGEYVGEWKNSKPYGQGTFTIANGDKYVGEFKNFEGNGQGTITWANGDKYVGESKDFKRYGQGTKTWANGDKYVGEWKDSKRHGQGTYTWVAGDKYVGKWKDGKTHGQGITTYGNGDKHVGERKDDELHGQGTYTWANGRQYVGEWKDGERHGQGTYTYADGRVVKGISKKDKFVAETLKKNKKLTQSNVKTSFVSGLTLSEEDALKANIFGCWSIPLGLPYNENLLVRIKLKLKSDGTVIKSEILDHARMNQPGQGFYKVLTESVLRAIRLCQPLIVPTTGYERWKDLQLNFDAREMFEG